MTIPTLVANYQQRGWDTADKVFKRKLEESLKVMNTQGTLAGYKTTEDFVNELQKHLKITKVCKNDDLMSCFEDKVNWGAELEEIDMKIVKAAKNFGQDDWDTNIIGIQLANGTTGLIAYNPECKEDQYNNQFKASSCVAVLYDTSGYAKPNTSGKDLRNINVINLGKANCNFKLNGLCWGYPFLPTPVTRAECLENAGGRYFCMDGDNDNWLGAVFACKAQGKRLPTLSELSDLIDDLPTRKVGSLTLFDEERLSEYGFSLGYIISIWSSSEGGCNAVTGCKAYSVYLYSDGRYNKEVKQSRSSTNYGICVE